ncbi:MAG: ATP-binding protein [Rhizobiales bacterium]|nr:ATP-binding protein [Hyphomicrobiales bacterium]
MLHLIIGNTGAGKTTYARKLKQQNRGIIFSIDQWNKDLFFADKQPDDGLNWFLERIERAETIIKSLIIQLENAGTDSILDLGFAKYSHRLSFLNFIQQHKFKHQIHYLKIDSETRFNRITKRNNEKGAAFQFEVFEQDFNFMESWFELPQNTELQNCITITQ